MLAPPLKKEHPESRCPKCAETETDDQMHTYGALLAEWENKDEGLVLVAVCDDELSLQPLA